MEKVINITIDNLKKNGMDAIYLEDASMLLDTLKKYIKKGDTVSFGGSVTLSETKVLDMLRELDKKGEITLLDRGREGNTKEDVEKIYRDTFFSDIYFSGSNAITEDGFLYNVDGNGNRVCAMTFGPKNVIIIAGTNKIVKNIDAAVKRVEEIAAPKNAKRLNMNTPCVKTGVCMHCKSEDKICRSFVLLGDQREKGRIKVILLNGEYGY